MSTVVDLDGRRILLVKGAPEILAGLCMPAPDLHGVDDPCIPCDADARFCP